MLLRLVPNHHLKASDNGAFKSLQIFQSRHPARISKPIILNPCWSHQGDRQEKSVGHIYLFLCGTFCLQKQLNLVLREKDTPRIKHTKKAMISGFQLRHNSLPLPFIMCEEFGILYSHDTIFCVLFIVIYRVIKSCFKFSYRIWTQYLYDREFSEFHNGLFAPYQQIRWWGNQICLISHQPKQRPTIMGWYPKPNC